MSGIRAIVNINSGVLRLNGKPLTYSGSLMSFALAENHLILLFDWSDPDSRVSSKTENVLGFTLDGRLAWKLDLSKSDVQLGPFAGIGPSTDDESQLHLHGFGPPDLDCIIDINTGKIIRHQLSVR